MSEWLTIGPLEAIPQLGARVIESSDGDIAIFRTGDDQVFALRDHCPHKGGPLSQGIVFENKVACPLHNWNIDLASGEAVSPDEGCAGHYEVKVEDGMVMVSL
ncbi:MAG: nitrite reductase small subunit NirD [Sedimenticola sp.]